MDSHGELLWPYPYGWIPVDRLIIYKWIVFHGRGNKLPSRRVVSPGIGSADLLPASQRGENLVDRCERPQKTQSKPQKTIF